MSEPRYKRHRRRVRESGGHTAPITFSAAELEQLRRIAHDRLDWCEGPVPYTAAVRYALSRADRVELGAAQLSHIIETHRLSTPTVEALLDILETLLET